MVKSVQFSTFVNEMAVAFPLVNTLIIRTFGTAYEISTLVGWIDENIMYGAVVGNQPAPISNF